MKIAHTGLTLPDGKVKYHDPVVVGLTEKFQPAKVSPYFFEFVKDDYEKADAIAIAHGNILDLLVPDIERIETRLSRAEDPGEQALLKKCLAQLEKEKPLCDLELDSKESAAINVLNLFSYKPVVVLAETSPDVNVLCEQVMRKANVMFFYTAGKQEVHAWFIRKGTDAVTCAGKIHTDLARGFIKAEIVSFDDMMKAHSLQDARSKGLTKLVDKDYIIGDKMVLDIRFNV